MTREELDSATFNAQIGASGSETLEVQTGRAEDVVLFIDDGTTGGAPATYSLSVDTYHDEYDDYQRQTDVSGGSAFYHEFTANGSKMQVTITDTSSVAATRRVTLKSYRQME